MTFKEELKKISDIVTFELSIANECAAIKDKMREAASIGIRSFQIDIRRAFPGYGYGKPTNMDNYYVINAKGDHCNDDYKKKVLEFLKQSGFHMNEVEIANITNNAGCHTSITIRW